MLFSCFPFNSYITPIDFLPLIPFFLLPFFHTSFLPFHRSLLCSESFILSLITVVMLASSSFEGKRGSGSPPPPSLYEKPLSSPASVKKWMVKRQKVKQALVVFQKLFAKLFCEYKADRVGHLKAKTKALMEAAMLMRKKHQWENTERRVGHVLGIEVGDQFQYRTELNVIGLHRQFSSGIDYMGKGSNSLATSIVVTNRYANARKSSGSLIYIGHGGNPKVRNAMPYDQKLEGGNLALKNSMEARSPVRAILKIYSSSCGDDMDTCSKTSSCHSFIYDGLYLVEKMTQERGKFGKLVFKFVMSRISEQPTTCIAPDDLVIERDNNSGRFASFASRKNKKSKACVAQKDVVCVNDISKGQEKFPIRVVTSSNSYQRPPSFEYIVDILYSGQFKQPTLCGCDCQDGCVDCERCVCIVKNGGTVPYDSNKRLASHMESLIYECGYSCRCSLSCVNHVSQCGIQFQLEIFKTELKGWGVRTRSFIPSGSFVCEYIGEVYQDREAVSRLDVDDYIFEIGACKGFIDATRHGNVARFINHSCSPNLDVKDILYDHNDKSIPHKMLFALKDIPAGRELSYDYNCRKGISKFESKSCYCGSRECIGQIYI